jgi:outer membrane receptor protein involved in Fe transport
VTDTSDKPTPGAVVVAVQTESGLEREATANLEGRFQLAGLPIGTYKVTTTLPSFKKTESTIAVGVGANISLNPRLLPETVNETVTVTATEPLDSSQKRRVDLDRLESLPQDGRQFADIVSTLPGMALGLHSDPSKGGQHTVQVNGGNGRNMNITVDGGDNNDDTVGGVLQQFPLESIQEISVNPQRFDAELGRGSAAMIVVTKSGGNQLRGSWFNLFRDDALNSKSFSETLSGSTKQAYGRNQFGGSVGGPIQLNKLHFHVAYEHTNMDTRQVVDTGGLLPGDGTYDVPYRQDLFSGKITFVPDSRQYLAVRYAREHTTQPSGVSRTTAYSTWADSTSTFDSVNVNHNLSFKLGALNEIVFQASHFLNDIPTNTPGPAITLASGAKAGANANTPQSTEQTRYQVRNDFSFMMSSHQLRTGVSFVRTPTLAVINRGGTNGIYTMASNDIEGGVASIMLIGGPASSNLPMTSYGFYVQDDYRVTDRVTINAGLRYDYTAGMVLDQTSQNFANMQAAGLTGRFDGTLLSDFGLTPRADRNNWQPRVGVVWDVFGNGRDLVRGGWGIYTDFAFTNMNMLTASLEGSGIVMQANCSPTQLSSTCGPQGFLKTDGTLFTIHDPIESIGLPLMTPTTGEVVSPRLEQPYSYQTNAGWLHELNQSTSISVDYVRVEGHDINMRMRPNVDTDPSPTSTVRYLAGVGVTPNTSSFRTAISRGRSQYDALIFNVRRRMTKGLDVDASYTLSSAKSDVGTATDELTQNLLQNIADPFSPFQLGPTTRTDSRHRVTVSAIAQLPYEFRVAAIAWYQSALPVTTLEGVDLNADGVNNDHTPIAYRFTGLNADGTSSFEEAGTCATVNCSRRAPFSQIDLRISRSFRLFGSARIEGFAEVFNLFNATNPSIPASTTRMGITPPATSPAQLATFMQPTAYAGDAGQRQQRVGQLGIRLTF